jgi:hypothetical protein
MKFLSKWSAQVIHIHSLGFHITVQSGSSLIAVIVKLTTASKKIAV